MPPEERKKPSNPWETLFLVVGIIVVLFVVWVIRVGMAGVQSGVGGIFLHAPPPLGNGQPYGPEISTSTNSYNY